MKRCMAPPCVAVSSSSVALNWTNAERNEDGERTPVVIALPEGVWLASRKEESPSALRQKSSRLLTLPSNSSSSSESVKDERASCLKAFLV